MNATVVQMKMKMIHAILGVIVGLSGCAMVPTSGSGGGGSFNAPVPLNAVTHQLADALQSRGYEVSITSNGATRVTLELEYPSRTGFVTVSLTPSTTGEYGYQWRLTHGVLDHHEARAKQEFLETLDQVFGKWSAQPEAGGYRR